MIEIRTHPHTDEHGIRTLRDDNCPGICVKGAATPDVCAHYTLKSAGEGMKSARPEIDFTAWRAAAYDHSQNYRSDNPCYHGCHLGRNQLPLA